MQCEFLQGYRDAETPAGSALQIGKQVSVEARIIQQDRDGEQGEKCYRIEGGEGPCPDSQEQVLQPRAPGSGRAGGVRLESRVSHVSPLT